VIHLLNRRKIKNIPFSTIRFLKRLEKKQMRNLRIRQLLLLFLRTAIVLCLVLAFSRPTLREDSAAGLLAERSAIEAIVIVDNSQSLNEVRLSGSLLDKMRQTFSDLQEVFQPGDRISVIQATNPQEMLVKQESYSADLWDRLLTGLQPNYARSDLASALNTASQQLNESIFASREVYIVSDFQESGFGNNIEEAVEAFQQSSLEDVRIFSIPLAHENRENLSIDSVEVLNRLVEVNQPIAIRAIIRNHHPEKSLTSLSSVVLGNNRVAQQNLNIAAGQSKEVRYEFTLTQTGFVDGMVTLESDALQEDNKRFFNFYVPPRLGILHLHDEKPGESYLPLILQPAIEKGVFDYKSASSSGWSSQNFNNYDVVLLEGMNQIPTTLTQRLRQFSESGGGVVIIPGENAVAPQYRELLTTLKVGTFLERIGNPGSTAEFLSISTVNWQHPVFEGLFEKTRPLLNPIEIYGAYTTKTAAGAGNLIALTDKSPLLLQGAGKGGVVFYLSTPLKQNWSQLPVKGFIVPLLYRMVYYSGIGSRVDRQSLRSGRIFRQDFANLQAPYDFKIVANEAVEARMTPRFQGNRVFLEYQDTALPGNYGILHNNEKIHILSVNPWPEEALANFYSPEDVATLIPNSTTLTTENMFETVQNSRFGKELWRYFLIAALLMLVLEMIIARTGSRKDYESLIAAEGGAAT